MVVHSIIHSVVHSIVHSTKHKYHNTLLLTFKLLLSVFIVIRMSQYEHINFYVRIYLLSYFSRLKRYICFLNIEYLIAKHIRYYLIDLSLAFS